MIYAFIIWLVVAGGAPLQALLPIPRWPTPFKDCIMLA